MERTGREDAEEEVLCVDADYMEDFQCDGAACDSFCCKNWGVFIDDACLARWSAIEDPILRAEALAGITQRKDAPGKYRIAMRETGECPFLTEERLCKLQKRLGEGILSDVCASYPRVLHGLHGVVERGLSLSCPVACRKILLADHPLRLTVRRLPRRAVREDLIARIDEAHCARIPYAFELQGAGLEILSRRDLSRDERLILLGEFSFAAEELIEEGRGERIAELASRYCRISGAEFARIRGANEFRADVYMAYFSKLLEHLLSDSGIAALLLRKEGGEGLSREIIEEYGLAGGENSLRALTERYRELRSRYDRSVAEPYTSLLDNEIVQAYYVAFEPFRYDCTLRESYLNFLAEHKFYEFALIARASRRALGREALISYISFTAGLSIHATNFVNYVCGYAAAYPRTMETARALIDLRS